MSISNPNIDEAIKELQQFLANGNGNASSAQQLQQQLQSILSQIQQVQGDLTQLQAQLADLQKVKDPTPEQKQQMASLQNQITEKSSELSNLNQEANSDRNEITNYNKDYAAFVANSKLYSNEGNAANKQLKATTKDVLQSQSKSETNEDLKANAKNQNANLSDQQTNAADQAAKNAELAAKSVSDYAALQVQCGTDALAQMTRIKNDENRIAADKAKEEELKDRIIEDSIKAAACYAAAAWTFGASLAAAAYYAADAIKAGIELQQTKDDEAAANHDLDEAKAALQQDLNTLTKCSIGEISDMVEQLFTAVDKIIKTLSTGQGSVEDATKALAEVLSFLQMITTKVHQLKEQDQVWMDRANAMGYEEACFKAQVNFEAMGALLEYAQFMKTVMTAVQVLADVGSIAAAVASGGTLAPIMATLMVILSASGVFNKATEALAHAMSKSDAVWAQVVAEVVVTVVSVILTCSLSAAADEVAAAVARDTAEEVSTRVAQFIKSLVSKLFSAQTLKAIFSARTAGVAVMYFGANNGFADLAELLVAAGEGKGNESKKELEKDKTFQILQIVMGVIQAIIMMYAGYKCFSGEQGQKSLLEMIFGKIQNLEAIMAASQGVQMMGDGLNVVATSCMASNSAAQANLTEASGQAEGDLLAYKAMQDMKKIFEGKELESFASLIQQEVQSLLITLRKMGEAEMEASRLLLETAV
jgi:hypothetical protein